MIAAVVAGLLFASVPGLGQPWLAWLCGAVLVQLRLLANVLDGMVAVGRGVASPVGELYNEIPDRVSDTAGTRGDRFCGGQSGARLGRRARGHGDRLCARDRAGGGGRERFPGADGEAAADGAGDRARAWSARCCRRTRIVAAQVALWVVARPFAGHGWAAAVGYCAGASGMMGQAYGERVTVGDRRRGVRGDAGRDGCDLLAGTRWPGQRGAAAGAVAAAAVLGDHPAAMLGPVLLGRVWLIAAVTLLGHAVPARIRPGDRAVPRAA